MNSYRLYVLGPQERLWDAQELQLSDDEAAVARADALRQDHCAVEVWSGERLVARLGAEFSL
ncbi:hypothetical protein M9M90_15235 [Phenylobacterium sp. LH3H17]|uniref:hypothetical protein n=1 Tax=Phenylobacterium sp. LH3H17 TaxID=2903901 RepID=UPI0020C9673D|nr:hypothetical protein [Phenylobacterium sp. LH3H17]UTP38562.1 hypothetical protein M9M90_15235 [Phenylobacterium sp. LH3H17]